MVLDHLKMSLWYASRSGLIHVSYYGEHIDGIKHEIFYDEQKPCAYELIAHIDYERDGDDISVNMIDVFHISDAGENGRHSLALIPEDDIVLSRDTGKDRRLIPLHTAGPLDIDSEQL